MAWRVEQLQQALALIARTTPKPDQLEAVSYTHLTLPTNREV